MLIGRSITGIQAGDVIRLADILKDGNEGAEIIGFAQKEMAPVLLHAAAFGNDFSRLILIEPYTSWRSIAMERFYDPHFIMSAVPGALKEYDIPDLAAALSPAKLFIAGASDGNGSKNDSLIINSDLQIILKAYSIKNTGNDLEIVPGDFNEETRRVLLGWIK